MENKTWKFVINDDSNGNHTFTLDTGDIAQIECDVAKQMVNNEMVVTHYVLMIYTRINICNKNSRCLIRYYENKEDFDRDYASMTANFNIDNSPGSGWILK